MEALVVVAHPDDEVLGCGGTIARLVEQGHGVSVVILGEGATSRYDKWSEERDEAVAKLRQKSQEVTELLGVKKLYLHAYPDNQFDTVPFLSIVKTLEEIIKDLNPTSIYTHFCGDLNIDHRIVFRAVMTAVRPVKECSVKEVFSFEVLSSTEWAFGRFGGDFCPNVFVDIDGFLEKKIRALQYYENEARDFPHPRSPEVMMAYASRWGSVVGKKYVEAFELIRSIR